MRMAFAVAAALTVLGAGRDGLALGIFWGDTNPIHHSNLDGSSPTTLSISPAPVSPAGIAVDSVHNRVYWVEDSGTPVVRSANFDGSGATTLISTAGGQSISGPNGIAVDPWGGKVYYADIGLGAIRRADLNGGNLTTIVSGQISPYGVAVDPAGGKVYWAAGGSQTKVMRSNLDGSGLQALISADASGVTQVVGANPNAVAIDYVNQKLYWDDISNQKIYRMNLDGTGNAAILTGVSANGIAVDPNTGVYWDEISGGGGTIARAPLLGGAVTTLVNHANAGAVRYLALDIAPPPSPVPEPASLALVAGAVIAMRRRGRTRPS